MGKSKRVIPGRQPPAATENWKYLVLLKHRMQMGVWLKVSLNK